jgi:hypothetical protein
VECENQALFWTYFELPFGPPGEKPHVRQDPSALSSEARTFILPSSALGWALHRKKMRSLMEWCTLTLFHFSPPKIIMRQTYFAKITLAKITEMQSLSPTSTLCLGNQKLSGSGDQAICLLLFYFVLFILGLGFKLRASHLQSRHSTT